ncbi:MAG: hypothetical protein Q4A75_09610, partial [Peptostreptococcaceae bacterium]|nr:hypothetical protein [Peptostreptococcaceae bacterium]
KLQQPHLLNYFYKDEVIRKIKKAIPNSDIVFYDLTRGSIGIPVVRTLITGDIQRMSLPLIAVSDRLLRFQKDKGHSEKIPAYEELFMGPYPH